MAEFSYKNFSETDFEAIKESLKTHLKSQDVFKDYDFEGSAISVLLNLLAYNTQYNAYYLNMMASEKFINHAQKRENVVGLANNLGYIPKSAISATAYPSFDVVPNEGFTDNIVIPKDVKFTTSIDGITYQFLTTETSTYQLNQETNRYNVTNLEIKEGRKFIHRYVVDSATKFYRIPNKNVDLTRLSVKVSETVGAPTQTQFLYYSNVLDVDSTTPVYYIQEAYNQEFELYFGDGVLGKRLEVGNEIIIEYYVTSGASANGATEFILSDEFTGLETIENLITEKASNGFNIESVESVRLSATKSYQNQNRAVTVADYKQIIKNILPIIADISVWGGEDATPKQYGKVFISGIREDGRDLTISDKNDIIRELTRNYSILSIIPEVVDVENINLKMDIVIRKDPLSTKQLSQIRSLINENLRTNFFPLINRFNANIYKSTTQTIINASDSSVISNTLSFSMYYDLYNKIITDKITKIYFPFSIKEGSVMSSTFTFNNILNCALKDVGGVVSIYRNGDIIVNNIMSVNYDTGTFTINTPATIFDLANNQNLKLMVSPESEDILLMGSYVSNLKDEDISITFND